MYLIKLSIHHFTKKKKMPLVFKPLIKLYLCKFVKCKNILRILRSLLVLLLEKTCKPKFSFSALGKKNSNHATGTPFKCNDLYMYIPIRMYKSYFITYLIEKKKRNNVKLNG